MPLTGRTKTSSAHLSSNKDISFQHDYGTNTSEPPQNYPSSDFLLSNNANSESNKTIKDRNEKTVQKQLRIQQKLKTLHIPDCVKGICPRLFDQYQQLLAYERSLDNSIHKQKRFLKESQEINLQYNTRKKIRIHIYNTFENQKPRDYELASLDPQHLLHTGPPSWSLKIQGITKTSENDVPHVKFSSFFTRIMIISDCETILWDKQLEENSEIDGIEINRTGDEELEIQILFFFDYSIPTFSLSAELAHFLGSERSTLPAILRTIWNYALTNCLSISDTKIRFKTDPQLNLIFNGSKTFELSDIPGLISHHLLPPKPILITHKLKLKGDWIQNCQTYDIFVDNVNQDSKLHFGNISSSDNDPETHQLLLEKDQELAKCLEKLHTTTIRRNFYESFSKDPINFINSILTSKFTGSEKSLLSEHFLNDYKISDELSKYYKQPWLACSIDKYLEKGNSSFEDEICNVVASMSIPDEMTLKVEEEEIFGSKRHRYPTDGTRSRFPMPRKKRSK